MVSLTEGSSSLLRIRSLPSIIRKEDDARVAEGKDGEAEGILRSLQSVLVGRDLCSYHSAYYHKPSSQWRGKSSC